MKKPEALATARLHGTKQGHVVGGAVVVVGAEEGQRLQRHEDVRRLHHLDVVQVDVVTGSWSWLVLWRRI